MGDMTQILSKIMDYIDNMPIISTHSVELLSKLSDDFEINEIVKIIEMDVALSVRCLQTVNSAAFGLRKEVSSIKQALVLLGSSTIIKIALLQGFGKILSKKLTGYDAEKKALWSHSIKTGIASRILSDKYLKICQPDLAYTAGLLHDIGKVVTSDFLSLVNEDLNKTLLNNQSKNFLDIEASLLDINHTEVGELMAKEWNFPEVLLNVIRFHHTPHLAKKEFINIVSIVHLGDILAMMGGAGTGSDSMSYDFDKEVYENLNINKIDLNSLIFDIDEEYLKEAAKLAQGTLAT
jgi:putative nucleotidyltransferase with HDIG domain